MTDSAQLATPMVYAGFWRRKFAYGIDIVLVFILYLVWSWLLGHAANAQTAQDIEVLKNLGWVPPTTETSSLLEAMKASNPNGALPDMGRMLFELFVSLAVAAIYNIFFLVSPWQATPGKHWCRMRVVMRDGRKLNLWHSTARHLTSGISMLMFGLGYVTMAFSKEKAALHDLMCGTRVIMKPADA